MRFRTAACPLTALAMLALIVPGCGDGPKRVRVSGTVTFQGKPVPYGNVVFEPDKFKGNSGPQGYATIKDGRFDTAIAGGTDPAPGPQIVAIEGYPELGNENAKKGKLVFNHRASADLTGKAMTLNFDVPASAGRRLAGPTIPPP